MPDSPVKQSFGKRRYHQCIDAERACRLSGNSDIAGVSTECFNIPAYPLKGFYLIEYPVISRGLDRRFSCELRVRKKT